LDPTDPAAATSAAPVPHRAEVLDLPVLMLNRFYVPIRVTSVRRAMVMLYTGHAHALDGGGELFDFARWSEMPPGPEDDRIQLVNSQLRAPRVLHLSRYDRVPQLAVRLTRQNLLLRDQYQCQYCGKRPGPAELNLDHVVPRSRGGGDSWDNLVVSCRHCNLKKGKKTPREAGMHLLKSPVTPKLSHAALLLQGLIPPFVEWQPFLATG
jgi:5-methylcytosine-specific restriction endonuclease McrA